MESLLLREITHVHEVFTEDVATCPYVLVEKDYQDIDWVPLASAARAAASRTLDARAEA